MVEIKLITEDAFMSRVVFFEIGTPQELKNHVHRVLQLKQTGKIKRGSETTLSIQLLFNPNRNAIKKQASYINCIGKFNKSKLWCDVVGD